MAPVSADLVLARRRESIWTKIHPIFALGQLATFIVSVVLLGMYFNGSVSFETVHHSVVIKILLMIGAVVTGALWEKDVYGHYWFAPEFFLEDVMTVNVFVLHIGYILMAIIHPDNVVPVIGMLIMAYIVYIANVAQYVIRTHQNSRVRVQVRA